MTLLKRWKINKYTVLFALVFVIGVLDISSDLFVGAFGNDSVLDIVKDVFWSFIALFPVLVGLRWKDKWGYGLAAFYGVVSITSPLVFFPLLLSKIGFDTFLLDPRAAHFRLAYSFDFAALVVAIPVFILSFRALAHVLRQEKRVRALSERELVHEYFRILATHKNIDAAKDPDKARKMSSDFYWDLYEVERRDKELANTIKNLSAEENIVSNAAAKKLKQRFGDELLSPFRYKGK
jgi:hypothetical protein